MAKKSNATPRPKRQPTGEYETGYCKPPVATRFKPGQSGNLKGRAPNPSENHDDLVREELDEKICISHNGEKKLITRRRAILRSQVNEAIKGNCRAGDRLLERERQTAVANSEIERISFTLSFPEEDNRLVQLVNENDELYRQNRQLEAQLLEARASLDAALTPPSLATKRFN